MLVMMARIYCINTGDFIMIERIPTASQKISCITDSEMVILSKRVAQNGGTKEGKPVSGISPFMSPKLCS